MQKTREKNIIENVLEVFLYSIYGEEGRIYMNNIYTFFILTEIIILPNVILYIGTTHPTLLLPVSSKFHPYFH